MLLKGYWCSCEKKRYAKVRPIREKQYPWNQFPIPNDSLKRNAAFDYLRLEYNKDHPRTEIVKHRVNGKTELIIISTDRDGRQIHKPISFKDICNAGRICVSRTGVTDISRPHIPDEWIEEYLNNCDAIPEMDAVKEEGVIDPIGFVVGLFLIAFVALIRNATITQEVKA